MLFCSGIFRRFFFLQQLINIGVVPGYHQDIHMADHLIQGGIDNPLFPRCIIRTTAPL